MKTRSSKPARNTENRTAITRAAQGAQAAFVVEPVNLYSKGVDAIINVQKNTLDEAAQYGWHAIDTWKKLFCWTFGPASDAGSAPRFSRNERVGTTQPRRVLPFNPRSGSQASARSQTAARRRRSRSKAA